MSLTPRLTPAVVTAAASRALGQLVVDAVHHPVGWGNENWRVSVGSGEQFIVKCGPSDMADKLAATTSAYALAREAGVPIPRLERFEASCSELDGAVMRIFEWVDGVAPERVLAEAGQCRRFFTELGSAVRTLHAVAFPTFSSRLDGSAPAFTTWGAYVDYRLPQIAQRVRTTASFTAAQLRSVTSEIRQLAHEVSPTVSPSLCHRDLYLGNMLASEDGGLTALIDFDLAEAWDPVVDLVKLRWLVFPRYAGAQEAFETTYFGEHRPPTWEARIRLAELLELVNNVANARAKNDGDFEELARARLRALAAAAC